LHHLLNFDLAPGPSPLVDCILLFPCEEEMSWLRVTFHIASSTYWQSLRVMSKSFPRNRTNGVPRIARSALARALWVSCPKTTHISVVSSPPTLQAGSRIRPPDMEWNASRVLVHSSKRKNLPAMRETARANKSWLQKLHLQVEGTVSNQDCGAGGVVRASSPVAWVVVLFAQCHSWRRH
jgi:hypothetical protein